MNAKRYLRGMLGQGWYNFTECLAWAILYRKMPEELEYCHKVAYGRRSGSGSTPFPGRTSPGRRNRCSCTSTGAAGSPA